MQPRGGSGGCSELGSDDQLQAVKSARSAPYQKRGEIPGLLIRKGCTLQSRTRTAIATSANVTRTRTKYNVDVYSRAVFSIGLL